MRRGFTLLEVLTVIAILMVLTAIMAPVFASARRSAQIHASLGRLRQLHQAVALYQIDHSGGTVFESLPYIDVFYSDFMGFNHDFLISPCGYQSGIEGNTLGLSYQYWAWPNNRDAFAKYDQRAVLFSDPHCNLPDEWYSVLQKKRGLGVNVGGQLLNLYKIGDASSFEWWVEE